MSSLGKVTVVMPNYNYAKYLSESIQSVLTQSHKDLELIVIDDCSKDNSVEILREWAKRDPRVFVLENKINQGAAESQNLALKRMSGDFLALCDADDVWYPQKLEIQLNLLSKNPRAGLAHAQAVIIDSQGKPTGKTFTEEYNPSVPRNSGDVFDQIVTTNYPCSSSTIIRRECVEYAGRFDNQLKYLYDWTYWVRVARKYEFVYVPEPLLSYRVHGSSTALDGPGYDVARITASQLNLQRYPDLSVKLRSALVYKAALSQLALGLKYEARSSFASLLMVAPWNWKVWIRWVQTFSFRREATNRRVGN
jgi:glycosyltransferase involved in cell wall biosynthesis